MLQMVKGSEINEITFVRKVKHLTEVRESELDMSPEKVRPGDEISTFRPDDGIRTFVYLKKGHIGVERMNSFSVDFF